MKQIKSIIALSAMVIFVAIGCGRSETTEEQTADASFSLVQVTKKQFESEGMKIGEPVLQYFEDALKCNGYVMAPASGMAQVSAPLPGIVQSIHCSTGEYVRKGQVLCKLTSNDLMLIQQEFSETSANFIRLQSEYKRSKVLFDEKIKSEKDFMAIESEYSAVKSKYRSLKLRLEILNLDVAKIEAGNLYASFEITAPINGYVTEMNLVLGQFAEQQKYLMEIVDATQLQLQLSVFENDICKLAPGQKIQFNTLGETAVLHSATITSIGRTISPESKTVMCIAKITNEKKYPFINNSYVEALITVNKKEVRTLPGEAILKSGKDFYVFVVEKQDSQSYDLRKIKITPGRSLNGFTEITGDPVLLNVLVKGVYNLPTD